MKGFVILLFFVGISTIVIKYNKSLCNTNRCAIEKIDKPKVIEAYEEEPLEQISSLITEVRGTKNIFNNKNTLLIDDNEIWSQQFKDDIWWYQQFKDSKKEKANKKSFVIDN